MDAAITVENISKRYRIGVNRAARYRTLRESITDGLISGWKRASGSESHSSSGPPASGTHWALRDVSFEVQSGEVVGIIGRNGAGKSTLLKILSRITEPTSGRARIRGRIGSLLEVGTGFHPELTGRENIYLNGSILGMSRREINRRFDEIVSFAEIEEFLETPVKRYSSGMYVRLAFGVAAHLEPEILLVDEVLAVGDVRFQKKCMGKMRDVGRSGRTVLFVSHNIAALESLCEQCILIDRGEIKACGETRSILAQYYEDDDDRASCHRDLVAHRGRTRDSQPVMSQVTLSDGSDGAISSIRSGSSLSIHVDFDVKGSPSRPVLGVVIKTDLGTPLFGVNNRFIPGFDFASVQGPARICCNFDQVPLMPGTYLVDLYFGNESRDIDTVQEAITFEVIPADVFGSGKLPPPAAGPIVWPATFDLRTSPCPS
jgi:lipopolysaccharide transport system ATP-binding protein